MEFNLFPGSHGRHPVVTSISQLINETVRNLRDVQHDRETKSEAKGKSFLVNKFNVGRVYSSFDQKDVSLPVRSEAVLPTVGPEYDIDFGRSISTPTNHKHLQTAFIQGLVCCPKGDGRRFRRITEVESTRTFTSERHGIASYRKTPTESGGESGQVFRYLAQGKVTTLRPMTTMHYQFQIGSIQLPVSEQESHEILQEILQDDTCEVRDQNAKTWVVEQYVEDQDLWDALYYLEITTVEPIRTYDFMTRLRLSQNPTMVEDLADDDDDDEKIPPGLEVSLRLPVKRIEAAYLADPIMKTHTEQKPFGVPGETVVTMITDTLTVLRHMGDVFHSVVKKEYSSTVGGDNPTDQLYYPGLFGDMAAGAKQHYNAKQINQHAGNDDLEYLRKFNNHCKRALIEEYCPNEAAICDIACGHGQDMGKYEMKNALFLYGADISEDEICEARRRLKQKQRSTKGGRNMAFIQYHVGNLLSQQTWSGIRKAIERQKITKFGEFKPIVNYDVVSCQLAIHYCLANEKQARELLWNISSSLQTGGLFYGSCPDTSQIALRLCSRLKRDVNQNSEYRTTEDQTATYSFSNRFYSMRVDDTFMASLRNGFPVTGDEGTSTGPRINFHPDTVAEVERRGDDTFPNDPFVPDKPRGLQEFNHVKNTLFHKWGLKYHFSLQGHIDMSEYVIPWGALCGLANEFGLRVKFEKNFAEYYTAKREQFSLQQMNGNHEAQYRYCEELHRDMGNRMEEEIRAEQEEVSGFYKVFVFEKFTEGTGDRKRRTVGKEPPVLKTPKKMMSTPMSPGTMSAVIKEDLEGNSMSKMNLQATTNHGAWRSNATPFAPMNTSPNMNLNLGGLGAIQSSIDTSAYGGSISQAFSESRHSSTAMLTPDTRKTDTGIGGVDESSSISSSDDEV